MKRCAAGRRSSTFSRSCAEGRPADARAARSRNAAGSAMRSSPENRRGRLSLATNSPVTWQARMRSSSITGAWLASDSSKPFSTQRTMVGRSGRGSSSHIEDFMRIGMGALLDDAGALAVVLAEDDQRAADHARRGQVGQRVGRDVGADDRLPGDRAAQRIVDRGAQHGGGRGLVGAGLEMHAELVEQVLRVDQHVDQMRDRRALVAADIGHARLQQRLGDGEDAFAVEGLAVARASAPALPS